MRPDKQMFFNFDTSAKFGIHEVTETTTKMPTIIMPMMTMTMTIMMMMVMTVTIVAMVMSAKVVIAVKEAAVMIIMDFSQ